MYGFAANANGRSRDVKTLPTRRKKRWRKEMRRSSDTTGERSARARMGRHRSFSKRTRNEAYGANASDTLRYNLGFRYDGREALLKYGFSVSVFYALRNASHSVF